MNFDILQNNISTVFYFAGTHLYPSLPSETQSLVHFCGASTVSSQKETYLNSKGFKVAFEIPADV